MDDLQLLTDLSKTTPFQRVQAAARYYRQQTSRSEFAWGLEHALKLMGEDGWQYIAPAWLTIAPTKHLNGVKAPTKTE